MSPQITFKSAGLSGSLPGAAGGALAELGLTLAQSVRLPFVTSHGRAPKIMPPAPEGLLDLGQAAALRVTGPEREAWLQGMQSADLAAVPLGGAAATTFLGGKGRLVAEGLVWRRPDEVLVTVVPERLGVLRAHLDKLLIMEDCELALAEGLHRLRYCPGESPRSDLPALRGSAEPLGFELLLTEAEAQALLETIPQRPAEDALERFRIALGVPAWGRDLDEETTPLEAGLDRAISYSKGCYVGQEVVAMATFRGRVSWNLVRLEVLGLPPQPGARLDLLRAAVAGGKKGRVTSAAQVGEVALLLGYVHRELIAAGSVVSLEDGRTATVLGLPYGSLPGAGVCA